MTTTNRFKEAFDLLLEPLGIKSRTFIVEYRDDKNNYYHNQMNIVGVGNDEDIVRGLIETIEVKGCTVYCVYEMLNGYSLKELAEMTEYNPQDACNHIKLMYLDLDKEIGRL